jgi:hypothetical protein
MTVYSGPHNARSVVRDSDGRVLPVTPLSRRLPPSVMSPSGGVKQDREAGMPWTRPEQAQPAGSEAPGTDLRPRLRSQLEAHLARLVRQTLNADKRGRPRGPALEDRMLKVCRVIEHFDPDTDDPTVQLAVLKGSVAFCVRTLSEPEMPPLRKALRLYLDDLKARHQ